MEKICAICGVDCSDRPRIKDPKGRYHCRACYDAAKRRIEAAQEADDESADPFGLESVVVPDDEESAVSECPGCGHALRPHAVLCTNCGYNLATGDALDAPVLATGGAVAGRRTVWPIVIGVLALVFAGFTLAGYGLEIPAVLSGDAGAAAITGLVLGTCFQLIHLIGGIGVLRRRQQGFTLLRLWARIAVILIVIAGTCLGVGLAFAANRIRELEELDEELASLPIGILAAIILGALLISLIWPVFLLAWFRREKIKEEVGGWR